MFPTLSIALHFVAGGTYILGEPRDRKPVAARRLRRV